MLIPKRVKRRMQHRATRLLTANTVSCPSKAEE